MARRRAIALFDIPSARSVNTSSSRGVPQVGAIFDRFGGINGSAYFIGGFGMTALTANNIVVVPIRSGIGLRLGANLGYLKFTDNPTWKPADRSNLRCIAIRVSDSTAKCCDIKETNERGNLLENAYCPTGIGGRGAWSSGSGLSERRNLVIEENGPSS